MKFMIFIGLTVFSYVGWWLGEVAGMGIMGCFVLSSVASIAGVWAGWKLANTFGLD